MNEHPSNPKPAPRPTARIHKVYEDETLPAWKRYALLAVGSTRLWDLLVYEVSMLLFSGFPGAAGYWLRQQTYGRLLGEMGRQVTIGCHVTIRGGKRIRLGDNVHIDDGCVLDARGENSSIDIGARVLMARGTIVRARDGTVRIGEGTDIGCHCILGTDSRLEMGREVLIAAYAYMVAGGNHVVDDPEQPVIRQGTVSKGGITVDDGSWIGARVTVLDGVHIGAGVVLGAHALATRDIPPRTIAYGIPAKIVRHR